MLKKTNGLSLHQLKCSYALSPSLLDYLPWVECSDEHECVLLNDQTVAAVFELSLLPCDSLNADQLVLLRNQLQGIFQDAFPLYREEESPWIMQCYLNDDFNLRYLYDAINDYLPSSLKNTRFSKTYLQTMRAHMDWLSRPAGVFVDNKVTGNPFSGRERKVRVVIYRTYHSKMRLPRGRSAIEDLQHVSIRLLTKLKSLGVGAKRLSSREFHSWLFHWFNPKRADALNKMIKTSQDHNTHELPFGYDFAEQLFHDHPKSDEGLGIWYFDGLPHRYVSIQHLNSIPEIGQLSRERYIGQYQTALFDQLPPGSVFILTMVLQSPESAKTHLARIEETARKSQTMAASITFEECQIAKAAIEQGNYLLPSSMGIYLRANDLDALNTQEMQVEALLRNQGFQIVDSDHELVGLHQYLHYLPACYRYAFDKKYTYRSSYIFAKQLANLLPLYGRERGSGHPLIQFFNRGGESFTIDPFNPLDKDQNSHLLMLGSTGSGKSATSTDLLIKLMASYRPRLVIVDAGNSFHLLRDYFVEQGLSVHSVAVTLDHPPVLNPFAESAMMLKQIAVHQGEISNDKATEEGEQRDYLAEMALAAQLMITGGERQVAAEITRQDRLLILDALLKAARTAQSAGFDQMIADDVVNALREMAASFNGVDDESDKQKRLRFMADSMAFFTKDTMAARVFNQRGEVWPDADVILFEQGLFKDTGYEAHNALAFMGLMSRTMAKAQAHQFDERFTVVYGDEIHTLTKNPFTVTYLTQCAKMSRKFGLWLWLATQNVADFPKEAEKILSMMEFWVCLGMSEAEMKAVEQFRVLSDTEKKLFRSVRKSAKQYVEGVLLCPRVKALFRSVPPRLSLALAMTEKHEKAARQKIMQAEQISELAAAKRIAEQMMS